MVLAEKIHEEDKLKSVQEVKGSDHQRFKKHQYMKIVSLKICSAWQGILFLNFPIVRQTVKGAPNFYVMSLEKKKVNFHFISKILHAPAKHETNDHRSPPQDTK